MRLLLVILAAAVSAVRVRMRMGVTAEEKSRVEKFCDYLGLPTPSENQAFKEHCTTAVETIYDKIQAKLKQKTMWDYIKSPTSVIVLLILFVLPVIRLTLPKWLRLVIMVVVFSLTSALLLRMQSPLKTYVVNGIRQAAAKQQQAANA